jgi:hypothetical protein
MDKKKGHDANAGYRVNDRWSSCDICGRDFRVHELKHTWDGKLVCEADYDPKQPIDFTYRRGESFGAGKGVSGAGGTFASNGQLYGPGSPAGTEYVPITRPVQFEESEIVLNINASVKYQRPVIKSTSGGYWLVNRFIENDGRPNDYFITKSTDLITWTDMQAVKELAEFAIDDTGQHAIATETGDKAVWVSNDYGETWAKNTADFTSAFATRNCAWIPFWSAFIVDLGSGNAKITTDYGATWVDTSVSGNLIMVEPPSDAELSNLTSLYRNNIRYKPDAFAGPPGGWSSTVIPNVGYDYPFAGKNGSGLFTTTNGKEIHYINADGSPLNDYWQEVDVFAEFGTATYNLFEFVDDGFWRAFPYNQVGQGLPVLKATSLTDSWVADTEWTALLEGQGRYVRGGHVDPVTGEYVLGLDDGSALIGVLA